MSGPPAARMGACGVSGRAWQLCATDDAVVQRLMQQAQVEEPLARLLALRGITAEAVNGFLDPRLRDLLPDPNDLPDMEAAVRRLADAVERREKVALFADYDVDGATSAAIMARYLRGVGLDPVIYVPDRLGEGYGPNGPALQSLAAQGCTLVVCLDCGTTAHEAMAAGAAAGLEAVIVDHHMAEPSLPAALAVVNPNRVDRESPCGDLATAGLAFVVAIGLNRELRQRGLFAQGKQPDLMALLDLVALGTVADVVPLVGLNRAFVRQGLRVLRRSGHEGLRALLQVSRVRGDPAAEALGFALGPRINAGGRVGEAGMGARLLATDDPVEAQKLAASLDGFNKERQAIERAVVREADAGLAARFDADDPPPLVIASGEDWHPGVVGIVASRLVERWRRPAIVIGFDGDVGRGSGRSIPGVDLGSAVIAARQAGLLAAGGGHAMAAGLTVTRDKLPALEAFLADKLSAPAEQASALDALVLDVALSPSALDSPRLVDALARFAPYGAGHREPRFLIPRVRLEGVAVMGQNHLRMRIRDAAGRLEGVAFRATETPLGHALRGAAGRLVDLAGCLMVENWQGRIRVRLRVLDLRHCEQE